MFTQSRKKSAPTAPASTAPPRDALAALMDGESPDQESLKFPSERFEHEEGNHYGGKSGRNSDWEDRRGDHHYDYKPKPSRGEYGAQPADGGALNTLKNGASRSGVYVKDKTTAGATYLKERDWSREKEVAGKAGAATKTGAVYVGSNVAKGAGWLWKSGKSGVDNLRGSKAPK